MTSNTNFISHILAIREWLSSCDGRAYLDFDSLKLEIRANGKCVEFLPQYMFRRDGKIAYTPRLLPEVREFIGWRHYFNRVWPEAVDKSAFKRLCADSGLLTPKRYSQSAGVSTDVLIKRSRSSFGEGIVGPLTPGALHASNIALTEGEYIEDFIAGDIAKIWYWNAKPVAIEILPMPSILGDGSSTVDELLRKRILSLKTRRPPEWEVWKAVIGYQGLSLESVLPEGQRLMVDYRYQSGLHSAAGHYNNALSSFDNTIVQEQLSVASAVFWNAIPANIRLDTLYTVDAIIDAGRKVWFLEMNCNPIVHVDAYPHMFDSLFEISDRAFVKFGGASRTLADRATGSIH